VAQTCDMALGRKTLYALSCSRDRSVLCALLAGRSSSMCFPMMMQDKARKKRIGCVYQAQK
jgi:hypothetical protein